MQNKQTKNPSGKAVVGVHCFRKYCVIYICFLCLFHEKKNGGMFKDVVFLQSSVKITPAQYLWHAQGVELSLENSQMWISPYEQKYLVLRMLFTIHHAQKI